MRNVFIGALLLAIVTGCGKSSSDGTKREAKPVDSLVVLAEQGDAEAQYKLGCRYCGRDDNKAFKWWRKSAEQGFAQAQFRLGYCYYYGVYVWQDYDMAVEWYTKAAEQGFVDAQYNLGWCYKDGEGVEQDYKKAFEWWMKAAEQGDPLAWGALGECYMNGEGVEQDYEKADEWWGKAIEAGYYPKGNGWIPMSNELAEMGYVGEQYSYGTAYYHGWYDFEQDYGKAVECFMNVVKSGDGYYDFNWVCEDVEFYLGLCYYYGDGVEQDYEKAVEWWTKSAEPKYGGSGCELAQEALRLTKEANGLFVDLKKKIDIE